MKIETRTWESEDERLADRLVERPAARRERVANKRVDPATAAALARLWGK